MYIHNLDREEVIEAMKNGATVFMAEEDHYGSFNFTELKGHYFNHFIKVLENNHCGFFTISE